MKECKTVLHTKAVIDGVEQEVLIMPITRLDCIEDSAAVLSAAASGDCIPIIDSSDNGQMKKIKAGDLLSENSPALQGLTEQISAAKTAAESAQSAANEVKEKIDSGTDIPASTLGGKTADEFAAAYHTHDASDISGLPSSLPANGGNADTVGGAAVMTTAALGLHRMVSNTTAPTSATCPPGCWYGQYE